MNSDRQSLEQLFKEREGRAQANTYNPPALHPEDEDILTAEGNASIEDLIAMIHRIVRNTMRDMNVHFMQEEGMIPVMHPDEPVNHPYITYQIINRKPFTEMKPRIRQFIKESAYEEAEARGGEIRGQKFKSIIQFNIFASVYDDANKVMERFEEIMMSYLYHFKKKGITDLFFEEQITDRSLDTYRQSASIKSLRYVVYTEKLYVLFRTPINNVEIMEDERRQ